MADGGGGSAAFWKGIDSWGRRVEFFGGCEKILGEFFGVFLSFFGRVKFFFNKNEFLGKSREGNLELLESDWNSRRSIACFSPWKTDDQPTNNELSKSIKDFHQTLKCSVDACDASSTLTDEYAWTSHAGKS